MKWNRKEGWFWILFLFDHNLQFPIFVVFSIIVDVFSIWLWLHSDDINAKSKGEKLHWPTSHTFSGASVGNVTLTCNTDKRTDVWSRNFLIWEIDFGLLAVAWAGPWEKGVWADSEQLFWVVFSIFHGKKK